MNGIEVNAERFDTGFGQSDFALNSKKTNHYEKIIDFMFCICTDCNKL